VFCAVVDAATSPTVIATAPGEIVSEPVVLVHDLTAAAGRIAVSRLVIEAGEHSEITVIHRVLSDDVDALFLPVVELDVATAARVRYVVVQELGPRMLQVASQISTTSRDANLSTMAVALGGSYARLRIDAEISDKGGHNELLAVYFGADHQMHDFRTVQHHTAPRTSSDLVFKGAVEDHSASVYSGLIKIGEHARGTVANQTNRNLLLSPHASAESVPNLEIENNDVKCSHASAIGPIDDDQLYYLEGRGVSPDQARRLIVVGFLSELLDRIPDASLRDRLTATIVERFDRSDARVGATS
jgi:Fe-S cluster assembly protein SufD